MEVEFNWTGKMGFEGSPSGVPLTMDAKAPLGDGKGPTPKHLLLSAVAGCTAMDVVALMRKHKQPMESLVVSASGDLTKDHPSVFETIKLVFRANGEIEIPVLLEAIELSQSKYCGVSAMVAPVSPIVWTAEVNGALVGEGRADFGTVGALKG